jgi:UDP-GlcNAc:undecaprenyl-phosphate GlcNAc-1-phosphate transferase
MEYQRFVLGMCGLLGAGVGAAGIALILRLRGRVDLPRRDAEMHHAGGMQKSRLGGVALAAAFVSVVVFFKTMTGWQSQSDPTIRWLSWKIMAASLAMFGLGLWDDFVPLGARRKLIGQLAIATGAYCLGIGIHKFQIPFTGQIIDLGFWSCLVTVVWLVALTNLINLIDGVDGLAGGICLMLMLLLVYVGGTVGPTSFIAAGMTGALLSFLWFNFPPARIYMGDGGAYLLGFLVGCLTISSSQKGTIFAALTAPLFVLALPILDTSLAVLRRGLQGLPLFRADRGHIHHRLLETGMSRRRVVLVAYGFSAIFLALGFAAYWWHGRHLAVLLGLSMLIILLAAGQMTFSREWFAVGRILGNSISVRSEIQYALAQTRWLVMEGDRSQSIAGLCEDTVFIARKLGFDTVRIRLEDGERSWPAPAAGSDQLRLFHHPLPGHAGCFIELGVACPKAGAGAGLGDNTKSCSRCRKGKKHALSTAAFVAKEFTIMSELLAEGWAVAIAAGKKQKQLPVRFDGLKNPSTETPPGAIPAALPETV